MLFKGGSAEDEDDEDGVEADGTADDEDDEEDLASCERPCISDALVSESRVIMLGL
jgi:hypothetical protein